MVDVLSQVLAKEVQRDVDYDFSALSTKTAPVPSFNFRASFANNLPVLELEAGPLPMVVPTPPVIVETIPEKFESEPTVLSELTLANPPGEHEEADTLSLPESAVAAPVIAPVPAKSTADISWPVTAKPDFGSVLANSLSQLPVMPATPPATPKVSSSSLNPAVQPNYTKLESGKVILADVKAKPRIFSPLDELAFMTIKNFRQLSRDPELATDLVKRKVRAIIADDFSRKVEAINAWKQSPVNRLYIDVLKEALNAGQPAEATLRKRLKLDPTFLTSEEFEAIIKLNQDLSVYK
jgi:hypothetical protein